jgi:hypothetical protein
MTGVGFLATGRTNYRGRMHTFGESAILRSIPTMAAGSPVAAWLGVDLVFTPADPSKSLTSQRITDFVVLLLVMFWSVVVSVYVLGVTNRFCLAAVALASVANAARTLVQARRSPERRLTTATAEIAVIAVAGLWTVVQLLNRTHPGWVVWHALSFSEAVRNAGALVALNAAVIGPRSAVPPSNYVMWSWIPARTIQSLVLVIGVLVATASVVVGAMSLVWVTLATVARRSGSRGTAPRRPALADC